MKTIEIIQYEVAKDHGYLEWSSLFGANNKMLIEVCKRYAFECCKASLEKAARSVEHNFESDKHWDYITSEDNIVL